MDIEDFEEIIKKGKDSDKKKNLCNNEYYNPFKSEHEYNSSLDEFMDRRDVIEKILYYFGLAYYHDYVIPIFIVGPRGIGATMLLYYIDKIFRELRERNPEEYSFSDRNLILKSKYFIYRYFFAYIDDLDEFKKAELQDIRRKMSGNYPCLCLDRVLDKDMEYFEEYFPLLAHIHLQSWIKYSLLISTSSPITFNILYQKGFLSEINVEIIEIIYLTPLSYSDVKKTLNIRIHKACEKYVKVRIKVIPDITDIFKEDALKKLYEKCFGVPGLILMCINEAVKRLSTKKIDEKIVDDVLRDFKMLNIWEEFNKLGDMKIEILRRLAVSDHEMSPSDLCSEKDEDEVKNDEKKGEEAIDKNTGLRLIEKRMPGLSTVAKHLVDLYRLGFVERRVEGRKSLYRITYPARVILEINELPESVKRKYLEIKAEDSEMGSECQKTSEIDSERQKSTNSDSLETQIMSLIESSKGSKGITREELYEKLEYKENDIEDVLRKLLNNGKIYVDTGGKFRKT